MKKLLKITGASLLILAASHSASAISFDFYKLDSPIGGGDFLPDAGAVLIEKDFVGTPNLSYTVGTLNVIASAKYNGDTAWAVQDKTTGWTDERGAGLGVYKTLDPLDVKDDNIDAGEELTLKFSRNVKIKRIILRADGHNFNNWADTSTFMLNGASISLPKGIGYIDGSFSGKTFKFAHSGGPSDKKISDDYYVAGVEVSVPDTGASAVLLGLGLVGLGAAARRFKK